MFYGPIGKQDDRPGLWLADIFSTSPVKPLNGIQRTLAGSKIASSSFTKFVFYGPIGKQDGRPGVWLADIFFTSPLNPLNWIQRNLIVIVIWTPLSSFFFRADRIKQRWPPLAQIGWDIYNFSSETTERNSTKLGRKQDLNVFFYQVCVLRTDRKTRWPPCPWLVEIFPTSPLKPLNGI